MLNETFTYRSEDGTDVFVYHWKPAAKQKVKGAVQIAHGMAETAERYERFARVLTDNGYIVYANDHRGHGRTAGDLDKVGYLADEDGFEHLIRDMHRLTQMIKEANPLLPVFLFAHSMGSFAAQGYVMRYGHEIKGLILSGTNGGQKILHTIALKLSEQEAKRIGRRSRSHRMNTLSFGNYNSKFKPKRTEFDWLSRDTLEVDKYIDDPYCGGIFTAGFFHDFMKLFQVIDNDRNLKKVPKDLPIYLIAGDKDPVGNFGKGVRKLFNRYKRAGIRDIAMKLYPEGRHELLNELNRNEVKKDIIKWLDKRVS